MDIGTKRGRVFDTVSTEGCKSCQRCLAEAVSERNPNTEEELIHAVIAERGYSTLQPRAKVTRHTHLLGAVQVVIIQVEESKLVRFVASVLGGLNGLLVVGTKPLLLQLGQLLCAGKDAL